MFLYAIRTALVKGINASYAAEVNVFCGCCYLLSHALVVYSAIFYWLLYLLRVYLILYLLFFFEVMRCFFVAFLLFLSFSCFSFTFAVASLRAFTLCFIQLYAMCRCALIKLRTQITYNKYSPHQRQWKRRTNSLFTIISTNAVASTSAEVCLPLAFFYGQYTLKALVCTNKYTYTHIRTCKFEPTYSWLPIYLFYK